MSQAIYAVDESDVDIVRAVSEEVAKLVGVTPPRVTVLPWPDHHMYIMPFGRDEDLDVIDFELLPTYVSEWEWEGEIPKFTPEWRHHYYGLSVLSPRNVFEITGS